MALQTSGAISLNDMHIEAANSYHSGSTCTINDADIRALIGKSSGATMSFNEWYGASSSLDTQTVTVGYQAGSSYSPALWGFTAAIGSISDGTFNVKSGASITMFNGSSGNIFNFRITGIHSNSGWSYFTTDGGTTKFYRSQSTYQTSTTYNHTTWTWLANQNGLGTFSNPLGTTANAVKTVVFL